MNMDRESHGRPSYEELKKLLERAEEKSKKAEEENAELRDKLNDRFEIAFMSVLAFAVCAHLFCHPKFATNFESVVFVVSFLVRGLSSIGFSSLALGAWGEQMQIRLGSLREIIGFIVLPSVVLGLFLWTIREFRVWSDGIAHFILCELLQLFFQRRVCPAFCRPIKRESTE